MTKHSLFPVPKVLLPALVIWIGIAAKFIATGDFDRTEAAVGFTALAYAVIGWTTPQTYDEVKAKVEKVVPTTGRRKR